VPGASFLPVVFADHHVADTGRLVPSPAHSTHTVVLVEHREGAAMV
jgi:hypothetical protein